MRPYPIVLSLAIVASLVAGEDSGLIPKQQRKDVSAFGFHDGKQLRTVADHKGRILVVDFWTTWCGPCRRALPELHRIQQQQARLPITIIPVNMDEDGWAKVTPFLMKNREFLKGFQAYMAGTGKQGSAVLGPVNAFPTTFLVDAEGKLAWWWTGYGEGVVLDRANQLLKELYAEQPNP